MRKYAVGHDLNLGHALPSVGNNISQKIINFGRRSGFVKLFCYLQREAKLSKVRLEIRAT